MSRFINSHEKSLAFGIVIMRLVGRRTNRHNDFAAVQLQLLRARLGSGLNSGA